MQSALRMCRAVFDKRYAERQGVTAATRKVAGEWLYASGFYVLLAAIVFMAPMVAHIAEQPRFVPFFLDQARSGRYVQVGQAVTPDDAGTSYLLDSWLAAWRLGSNDPNSPANRQSVALIRPNSDKNSVETQVRNYNRAIAKSGQTVSPEVFLATHTGGDTWALNWDETITTPDGSKTTNVMRAFITVGRDSPQVNDIVVNPFGLYVATMQVVVIGTVSHAR